MILDYVSKTTSLPFSQQVATSFTSELQWSSNLIVSIVLEGSLSIHYKNHNRDFQTHDIYFFPPFETFSVITSSEHTRVLTLQIDSTFINKLCPDVINLKMQQDHISYDLGSKTYYSLCCDFSTIIFNNLKTEMCTNLKLLDAVTNIVITIFESYGIKSGKEQKHEYYTDRIIDILHYINDFYSEKISINDIAGHLNIHPQYFSTFFNRHFHTSFTDYLTSYRINRSIMDLRSSNDSILDIAIKNGFSNHKTYAAAFRKSYGCSPTEYRKALSGNVDENHLPPSMDMNTTDEFGIFSYFRQFLQTDHLLPIKSRLQNQQVISLDSFALAHSSFYSNQKRFLSVGRAFACLRSEVQQQVLQANEDFDFDYVRIRDIFSDDLYVYYESENREPLYNWQSLDSVFDFILSVGAKPFAEIGYMPDKLASKKQFSGWQYHPNVSFPKSLSCWSELIRNFLLHYIDRYGITEVRSWYFDFWTCPDLDIKTSYWNESMEAFFDFYKATYEVFWETDSNLKLGSPNFSAISGLPWYEAFFQFCYANHLFPAYISAHIYGCELKGSTTSLKGFNEVDSSAFSISNQNVVSEFLQTLHQVMNRNGFRSLDVIVADWNLSFLPMDLIRDTCYMGPYICHTYNKTLLQTKGLCYWSLSDIHEDFFPSSALFRGGPGMMDYHGLKKASYNTIALISQLGNKILKIGENFLFIQKAEVYQLLIYNLAKFDYMYSLIDQSAMDEMHRYNIYSSTEDLYLNIILKLPTGKYYIKKYEVNRYHGSAYDIWGSMGFPSVLHKEIEDYIRSSSVPKVSFSIQDVGETLMVDETVPAHGVMLLEFKKQ